MKKIHEYLIVVLGILTCSSCTEEVGTVPGNDPQPYVTIYQYAVGEQYNPDNDIALRFVANNKVEEAYYLAEVASEKEAFIASKGEKAYLDHVVADGVKINGLSGVSDAEVTLTGMLGKYSITVAAVKGDSKGGSEIVFVGKDWKPKAQGVYTSDFLGGSWEVEVLYDEYSGLYRIANCWEEGYHVTFDWDKKENKLDVNGGLKFETGVIHSTYGMMSVTPLANDCIYDKDKGIFVFAYKWTVAAGSFGDFNDYLKADL